MRSTRCLTTGHGHQSNNLTDRKSLKLAISSRFIMIKTEYPDTQFGRSQIQPRLGLVSSSNPSTGTVRVVIQPDGILTGWLPVATQKAGDGWGIYCPLGVGDQVLVVPRDGDVNAGIVVGSLFSRKAPPPDASSDEIVISHKSGASIRLSDNGQIRMTGDLHVSGDIYDQHGSLSHLRGTFNAHTHRGTTSGSTSPPTQID